MWTRHTAVQNAREPGTSRSVLPSASQARIKQQQPGPRPDWAPRRGSPAMRHREAWSSGARHTTAATHLRCLQPKNSCGRASTAFLRAVAERHSPPGGRVPPRAEPSLEDLNLTRSLYNGRQYGLRLSTGKSGHSRFVPSNLAQAIRRAGDAGRAGDAFAGTPAWREQTPRRSVPPLNIGCAAEGLARAAPREALSAPRRSLLCGGATGLSARGVGKPPLRALPQRASPVRGCRVPGVFIGR